MNHTCRSKFHNIAIVAALNMALLGLNPGAQAAPNFGPNVSIFYPSTPRATIQSTLDNIYALQGNSGAQFNNNRYAVFFMPGTYTNIAVNMGYYEQVIGLGQSPDDVTIKGLLASTAFLSGNNATCNFWLSSENLAVMPTNSGNNVIWAASQDTPLRRMHIAGSLYFSSGGSCSGGFLADSKIDSTTDGRNQNQWFSRNDIWGNWAQTWWPGWNSVFVGISNPPSATYPSPGAYSGNAPTPPNTIITNTPLIREKPYLYVDSNTNYFVMVPALMTNSLGTSWASGPTPGVSVPISQFYLAQPGVDNAATINAALGGGSNVIFTPGIYFLTNSILVTRPDTIVMGLGFPSLVPTNRNPAMVISDVDGVKVSGIIFDAGTTASPSLLMVGTATSSVDHSADPICLYDICSRVGGQFVGTTTNCMTINANNVIGDDLWLWRADHGNGVGWTVNSSESGLVVNGNNVTIYGLAVEHHEKYQTLWNGNGGRVYFYQSEFPYDPQSQSAWSEAPGVNGYASYKVANTVTSHQVYGLGIYAFFSSVVSCYNAIETPTNQQVNVHHMMDVYSSSVGGSSQITHIINGTGGTIGPSFGIACASQLWLNPTNIYASAGMSGQNVAVSFPSESWHGYQLQYKNALTDVSWSNLGSVGGNDTLQTITDSASSTNRFYRVKAN